MSKRKVEFKVQSASDESHQWRAAPTDLRKSVTAQERTVETRVPRTRRGVPVVKRDLWMEEELDRRLRLYCVDRRKNLTEVIEEAVRRFLDAEG